MLKLHKVSRQFGGLHALANVDLNVPQGSVVGLIGPNGAGKTTLINVISGLDHPTSGKILLGDHDISRMPPHKITALGIARTYQNIRLFAEMTALENLLVAEHGHGRATILEALAFAPSYRREEKRLREEAMELLTQFGLAQTAHTPAGSLPYGDQRRLEIARAVATHSKLILLDEPTAGMNPVETQQLGEQILRIQSTGLTVLVIEHDMGLIQQVCSYVYVLNFGQIIAHGTYDHVKRDQQVIEAYLGEENDEDVPA
ncbi:MAG: ABC transporter ATP-binding protein [Anaerolineae bacterium]